MEQNIRVEYYSSLVQCFEAGDIKVNKSYKSGATHLSPRHDPCDPSDFRDPFDPWPMTHRPIPCSVLWFSPATSAERKPSRPSDSVKWKTAVKTRQIAWKNSTEPAARLRVTDCTDCTDSTHSKASSNQFTSDTVIGVFTGRGLVGRGLLEEFSQDTKSKN